MLIRSVKSSIARRRAAIDLARSLIAQYGREAPMQARMLATRALLDRGEADLEWDVVTRVEGHLGIHHQPDTATRYLAPTPIAIRRRASMRW